MIALDHFENDCTDNLSFFMFDNPFKLGKEKQNSIFNKMAMKCHRMQQM